MADPQPFAPGFSYTGFQATDPASPTTILVTHHVEEIPSAFTHLMLLRAGKLIPQGQPIALGPALIFAPICVILLC